MGRTVLHFAVDAYLKGMDRNRCVLDIRLLIDILKYCCTKRAQYMTDFT